MKKLLFICGLLWSAIASAQFTPGQLLTAQELNSQFALYAPLTGATYTGPVTVPTLTVTGTFTIPASTVLPSGVTATTNGRLDNSLQVATDAFVNQQGASAVATVPFANVTGGTYNQATLGSGCQVVVFASGGVITSSLTISNPGSGYAVGDLLAVPAGNSDAVLRVTGVSGGGVSSVGIAYGGTGYTTGNVVTTMPVPPGRRAVVFTGTLTSNLTFIIQSGTFLTASREVEFINNTAGAFTITVKLSNGAGGSTGTGVVLPQGTANSSSTLLYTDGVTDVWPANGVAGFPNLSSGLVTASGGNTPRTLANHFADVINARDFGVKCDGTTDDSTALNAIFSGGLTNKELLLPPGVCIFKSPLVINGINSGAIVGAGSQATQLIYAGASTTSDLLLVENGYNPVLQGFTIWSSTTMTAGAALHMQKNSYAWVRDVQAFKYTTTVNTLWNGLWIDQPNFINVNGFYFQAQNDAIDVSALGVGTNFQYDVFIDSGKLSSSAVGLHVGGGVDNVHADNTEATQNTINVLDDNAITSFKNQEIFLGRNFVADQGQQYNYYINDSLCNLTNYGIVSISGPITHSVTNDNIFVNSFPSCQLVVDSPYITASARDGIRVNDTSAVLSVSPATLITGNAGYGVNATGAYTGAHLLGQVYGNTTGQVNTTVAAANTVYGTQTIANTSSNSALVINGSGSTGGSQVKMIGNGATTPSKLVAVLNGQYQIYNDAVSTSIFTLTDSGNETIPGSFLASGGINTTTLGATTPSTVAATTLSSTGTFTPSQTAGIVGTTTNNNSNAGSVGEYVTATGTGVSLASTTPANITSISLTAGDWDVWGNVEIDSGTSTSVMVDSISTTSATEAGSPNRSILQVSAAFPGNNSLMPPAQRLSLSSTTTVYLVTTATFTGTTTGTGFIAARRRR